LPTLPSQARRQGCAKYGAQNSPGVQLLWELATAACIASWKITTSTQKAAVRVCATYGERGAVREAVAKKRKS
jgi:hypothetical protein